MTITDIDDLMMMSLPMSGRTSRSHGFIRANTPKSLTAPLSRGTPFSRTPRRLAYTHSHGSGNLDHGVGVNYYSSGTSSVVIPHGVAGTPTPYSSRSNSPLIFDD